MRRTRHPLRAVAGPPASGSARRWRVNVKRRWSPGDFTLLLWAVLCGLLGALATLAFREGIHALLYAFTGNTSGSLVDAARGLPWYLRIAFPTIGGLIAGGLLVLASRAPTGTASDYMEAITLGDGRIPVLQNLLRGLSSLVSIASGGSIGREGAMVQLAALTASIAGRSRPVHPERLRILVACGAAAGLTSAYHAPVASAVFLTEIVIGVMAMRAFGPILVACVTANLVTRGLSGHGPVYAMPAIPPVHGAEIACFLGLGLLCGALAPVFLGILGVAKLGFRRLSLPLPWRLALGGLGVGGLSILVPQVWGNGYSSVNALLHMQWTWTAVLMVLTFKILATALTTGSGAVGGVFTPALFVGAALGALFGTFAHGLWPGGTSESAVYVVVGMGAFLAAATRAPLTAILMVFEMTMSYHAVLPLTLACAVSHVVARSLSHRAIYEIALRRHRDAASPV